MILLITKTSELAESFIKDLRHEGFEVEHIANYGEALVKLQQNPHYQMIILDMEADGNEATEFCQMVKKDPQLKLIPLICIVKRDYIVEQLIAFELGGDEFLFVPYTSIELQLKMRSIQRNLDLQKELKEKENQLRALKQVQQILVTLSHYINNSLTPLYSFVQMMNEKDEEDARRLKIFASRTVEFINKVLHTLNNLVQSGEMRVVKDGAYKNLLLDIENELKRLQENDK